MHGRHPQSYSRFHSLRYRSIQAVERRKVKEILVSSFAYTRVLQSLTRAADREKTWQKTGSEQWGAVTALGVSDGLPAGPDKRVDLISGSVAKTPRTVFTDEPELTSRALAVRGSLRSARESTRRSVAASSIRRIP